VKENQPPGGGPQTKPQQGVFFFFLLGVQGVFFGKRNTAGYRLTPKKKKNKTYKTKKTTRPQNLQVGEGKKKYNQKSLCVWGGASGFWGENSRKQKKGNCKHRKKKKKICKKPTPFHKKKKQKKKGSPTPKLGEEKINQLVGGQNQGPKNFSQTPGVGGWKKTPAPDPQEKNPLQNVGNRPQPGEQTQKLQTQTSLKKKKQNRKQQKRPPVGGATVCGRVFLPQKKKTNTPQPTKKWGGFNPPPRPKKPPKKKKKKTPKN